ncbi:MAG: CHRD domain-containing protein [Candidatus Sericytochromatia bacterium]
MNKIISRLSLAGITLLSLTSCNMGPAYKTLTFEAAISGKQQVPENNSRGQGNAKIVLDGDEVHATLTVNIKDLAGTAINSLLHNPSRPGSSSVAIVQLAGETSQITLSSEQIKELRSGLMYINITSTKFQAGELRGQFFEKL